MVISKSPFRVSLFGGSTDYPEFYHKHNSLIISFAIDKYNYISVRKTPSIQSYKYLLQYSSIERLNEGENVKHNGIRGVLEYLGITYGIELSSMSDVTKMSGLGTSSSYIVGLVNALSYLDVKKELTPRQMADYTNFIERKLLKEPGGIQDPFPAAFGGFNSLHLNGNNEVKPMPLSKEYVQEFLDWSLMIYVGGERKSFDIASSHNNDDAKLQIRDIAYQAYDSFVKCNTEDIGRLLHKSWLQKRNLSNKISNAEIDKIYEKTLTEGAFGGKLLGAGGTGFLYLICEPKNKRRIIDSLGLYSLDFGISWEGSKLINK